MSEPANLADEVSRLRLRVAELEAERSLARDAVFLPDGSFPEPLQSLPVSIVLTRMEDGHILAVNDAFSVSSGYSREEAIGQTSTQLGTWSEEPRKRQIMVEQLLATGTCSNLECRLVGRGGNHYHVRVSARLVEIDGVRCVLVMSRNVGDLVTVQSQLYELEGRFQSVADSLAEGLLITDLDDVVLYANPRLTELTGFTQDELIGSRAFERLLPVEDWPAMHEHNRRRADGVSERYSMQLLRTDGSRFWADVSAAPHKAADGTVIGSLGAITDISERRRVDAALRLSLARERIHNAIFAVGQQLNVKTVVETAARELRALDLGLRAVGVNVIDEAHGTFTCYEVLGDDEPLVENTNDLTVEAVQSLLPHWRDGQVWERRPDDAFREVNPPEYEPDVVIDVPFSQGTIAVGLAGEPGENEDLIDLLKGVSRSLSQAFERSEELAERERIAAELIRLERLRAVGELSAGVSHNLNNLLLAVALPLEQITEQVHDSSVKLRLQDVLAATGRAQDLVHRLHLAVHGVEEDALEPVDVNDIIEQAIVTTRPRWQDEAQAHGVTIEVRTVLNDVPPIRGTASRLHDMVTNLIFNASDAMLSGGVIHIETHPHPQGVSLVCRDDGAGMDRETRERLFEPFFTTKKDVGSGLGLATVRATATSWGGRIEVDSSPGAGATFVLTLPAWEGDDKPAAGSPCPPAQAAQQRRGRILLVDDEQAVRHILAQMLSSRHDVTEISNPRTALQQFESGQFDVALLDLGLPELPGDELARQLRQIDPELVTVMISGWELADHDPRLTAFDLYLRKPFRAADLESVVQRALALSAG